MNMSLVWLLFTSCFHRFDCEFVISEVNANIHYFVKTDSGFKLAGSNNDKVGKNMSTKAAGSDSRLIVTSNYKFPKGSTEEAAALKRHDGNPTPPGSDVNIVIVPELGVPYGQDLKARLCSHPRLLPLIQ